MFLLQPRSKGYLRLSSKSPFSSPFIDPRYLSHPEDIEDFVRGIRFMRLLEQTESWKSIGATLVRQDVPGHCSEQIFDSDNYWRCIGRHFLTTASHFIGTCRMGSANDPSAVVDSRLRVIGIKNLRVADASVMRYIPSGHTNAPAMMIGEKAADMIRCDRTHNYNILTSIV
ncbi:glucose dehydrogenase [FAD, quinone]-like [Mytilus californianus]|uniref:glucose dehydrogenase [FAD, quinone]-like n=1 Tax=Mytilus californianus TaxID=6549 RepID=UPI0022462F1F|nr:glucose dehydrogenase [FAD, quinone]-like [Mytilus californianus]